MKIASASTQGRLVDLGPAKGKRHSKSATGKVGVSVGKEERHK